MNPPYAVAGNDIEPGMTVILAPGESPFVVREVLPMSSASTWLQILDLDGLSHPVQKFAWYAEVGS